MSSPQSSLILNLAQKLKDSPQARLLLSTTSIATLALLIRYFFSKETKYVSDNAKVGRLTSSSAEADKHYDVIIVGGGTSGCVLAARLSEDPSIRVLLLEAGQSGSALKFSSTPALFGKLYPTKHVLPLRTQPQTNLDGRTQFWPRAKLLGGCSSINAQMAQYGAPQDFDEWGTFMNDDSWSWKNFSKYFKKFEKWNPHPGYKVDASLKGNSGPVNIGYHNTVTDQSKAFIEACVKVGIPFTPDFNTDAGTVGVSRIMTYVDENKQRVSSETAYLTKDVLARRNLTVATHAQATRIIIETKNGRKRAVGVEFASGPKGKKYRAMARKEVIISAGAVQSPHLLMLSGIGQAAHLNDHGISVVEDLPGVGSHLKDHCVVDLYFKDKTESSVLYFQPKGITDVAKILRDFTKYWRGQGGPLATNFGESAAFVRTDDQILFPESEYPEVLPDSTSGPGAPDLELFTTPLAYKEHGAIFFNVHTYALHVYLVRPLSTGTIKLRSANPWMLPVINPNYLQDPSDAKKLLRGVRILLKIAQTQPLAKYLDSTFLRKDLDHGAHLKSDEELLKLVKDRVETIYHPTSTCRMAPREQEGVVDTELKVYGIDGLRVCDASIFPTMPSGHTAGACYATAEKLADQLKASLRSRN